MEEEEKRSREQKRLTARRQEVFLYAAHPDRLTATDRTRMRKLKDQFDQLGAAFTPSVKRKKKTKRRKRTARPRWCWPGFLRNCTS